MSIHEPFDSRPARCYVAVMDGERWAIGIAEEDHPGYYTTNYQTVATREDAEAWAEYCNKIMGIDKEEAARIKLSSIGAQNRRKK